jgi:integrase/recombinase XerD
MNNLQQCSLPFDDAFGIYILHCRSRRFRKSTIDFYQRRMPRFVAWLAQRQVTQLQQVNKNHVRAYLVEMQGDEDCDPGSALSAHYIHSIARALRAFFKFCVDEQWVPVSPMHGVAMPKRPKDILPSFTKDEIKRLQKAAVGEREQAIVLFLLDTGVRASELVALNAGDIELRTGTVRIREGKGEKARTVYVGSKSTRALLRYYGQRGTPAPNKPIWVADRKPHKRLTYFGLSQLLRRLANLADVPHCTAHAFRRTFAINCLRNGMDIYSLARLMGHEDIETLKPYLQLVEVDAEQAHRRFGVVDNL